MIDDLDDSARVVDAPSRLGEPVRIRIGQALLGIRIPRGAQIELVGSADAMAKAIESGWFSESLAARICTR